jgi:hypothetical protein
MDKAKKLSGHARFWAGQGKNLDSALVAARKRINLSPDLPYSSHLENRPTAAQVRIRYTRHLFHVSRSRYYAKSVPRT